MLVCLCSHCINMACMLRATALGHCPRGCGRTGVRVQHRQGRVRCHGGGNELGSGFRPGRPRRAPGFLGVVVGVSVVLAYNTFVGPTHVVINCNSSFQAMQTCLGSPKRCVAPPTTGLFEQPMLSIWEPYASASNGQRCSTPLAYVKGEGWTIPISAFVARPGP